MTTIAADQQKRNYAEAIRTGNSRPFTSKYNGECIECPYPIRVGDTVRFKDSVVIHARCDGTVWGADVPDSPFDDVKDEREPEPVVIGARQPKLCPSCCLEHAGECW